MSYGNPTWEQVTATRWYQDVERERDEARKLLQRWLNDTDAYPADSTLRDDTRAALK